MRMEELEVVCQEAARNMVARQSRPLPPTVVLPLPEATQVAVLQGFPDDDAARFDFLSRFAAERMVPANASCYGFVAEASLEADGALDVIVVAYGARRQRPRVTAAPLSESGLAPFGESEELDPTALPFLSPLQHAADSARPPDSDAGLSLI
ncbi:MAG TPA: hypothetical protein VML96_05140 [Egibacteraceae bacterium]|nr:hypothetical protein [Egibacteraceae bacterium]